MKKSSKGLTGHWTKWGGRVFGAVASPNEEPHEWTCQACGTWMPSIMPAYKYEYPMKGEYIRVCAMCYAEECIRLIQRATLDI